MDEQDEEHLATVRFKDGRAVRLTREGTTFRVESDDAELTLPRATGQQAVDLLHLLEGLGGVAEFPEDEEIA